MKADDLYSKITKVDLEISPFNFERFEIKDISYSKDSSGSRPFINIKGILTVSGRFRGRVYFEPEEEKNIRANYTTHDISRAVREYLERHENIKKRMIQLIEDYIKKDRDIRKTYIPERIVFPLLQKPIENSINGFKEAFTLYAVNTERETLFSMDKSDKRLMENINSILEKIVQSIKEKPIQGEIGHQVKDTETQTFIYSRIENYDAFISNVLGEYPKEETEYHSGISIINNTNNLTVKEIFTKSPNKYEKGYFISIETDFSVEVSLSIKPHLEPRLSISIVFEAKSPYISNFLKYFKTGAIFDFVFSVEGKNPPIRYDIGKVLDSEKLERYYISVIFRIPLFV